MVEKNILRVGIAGLGNVGSEVVRQIIEKVDLLQERCNKEIKVVAVSARDKSKKRDLNLDKITWYNDPLDLANDKNIDVVVELIGGEKSVAYNLCKESLLNGKHVVTANKAMLAHYGSDFAQLAFEQNKIFAFEAAVAGGIPIIKVLKESLVSSKFKKISGIMNGTCNYILSTMEATSREFSDILQEAQRLGYAESDPSFDIDGIDTAHKLAIVASIAFGAKIDFSQIYVEGIRHIALTDINYAKDLGYKIKLLGVCSQKNNMLEHAVYPVMVAFNSPIANISNANNAILIRSDTIDNLLLTGPGAGGAATASAVIADICDIACGRSSYMFNKTPNHLTNFKVLPIKDHECAYYLRLKVLDKTGVLAIVTSIFNKAGISMDSLLQKSSKSDLEGLAVDIVGITHITSEDKIKFALAELAKIDSVVEAPHIIRVDK